ncbi:MAG: fluoride efflux transporter CrcB [Ignavibacteria bacterium]|nr:fluoride efflux transporter CrcB [Ignavibacteria bacterium]
MKAIHQILLLILGGAFGTLLRFLVYQFADKHFDKGFPWGTLIVNLSGSFIIGLLWAVFEKTSIPPAVRLLVFVGILGSFTTFSTFAFDSFSFLQQGQIKMLIMNILMNNIGGLVLCFCGYYIIRFLT